KHARYEVVWKLEDKEPEAVEAEEWIGKKGYAAKGKKCAERGEVKSVRFVEPLIVDEPEEEIPDQVRNDELVDEIRRSEPANDGDMEPANDEPIVIPGEDSEAPAPVSLDDVPDLPGDLFDEPTLF
ncbi:MAG: hypothetical protein K6A62_06980, partial [Bacteroidales bacterium]|nr:hypothetical protein [Bacteroidales bacterium]